MPSGTIGVRVRLGRVRGTWPGGTAAQALASQRLNPPSKDSSKSGFIQESDSGVGKLTPFQVGAVSLGKSCLSNHVKFSRPETKSR